jgi:hypothetical protein
MRARDYSPRNTFHTDARFWTVGRLTGHWQGRAAWPWRELKISVPLGAKLIRMRTLLPFRGRLDAPSSSPAECWTNHFAGVE